MEKFLNSFSIEIDQTQYIVTVMLQEDESVVFVTNIKGQQLRIYKDENDQWSGNGDPVIVTKIGDAIERSENTRY